MIEQLMGIAIEAIAVQAVWDIVGEHEIDSTILARFQRDFEQIVADENFAISLKAKMLFIYDEIQRCFTSDRIGKGHLYLPGLRKISEVTSSRSAGEGFESFVSDLLHSAWFLFGHPNKEETLRSANELYDCWEQLSLKTAAQVRQDSETIDKKIEKLSSDNILLRMLTPAVGRVVEISNRVPTEVGGTLTIIAILRYKQDTGRYPQDLDQLISADYLEQLPMDSYSDKPLVYRRTDGDFTLYSIGYNLTDDGGKPGRDRQGKFKLWYDGDAVFWPLPKSQVRQ